MAILPMAVWERKPYWVPELKRQLETFEVRVGTCRFEADVNQQIADNARQLVIALPQGERLPLKSIEQWATNGLVVHVVLPPIDESYRWFLHELGATSVFDFDEARTLLARACQRAGGGLDFPRAQQAGSLSLKTN